MSKGKQQKTSSEISIDVILKQTEFNQRQPVSLVLTLIRIFLFRCGDCSKGFMRHERYMTHLRWHSGEIEKKTFPLKSYLL